MKAVEGSHDCRDKQSSNEAHVLYEPQVSNTLLPASCMLGAAAVGAAAPAATGG